MVVTASLGTWSAGLVFDVASHAGTSAAALATGSAWLIAIGTVVGLPAPVIGYLDLWGVPTGGAAIRTGLRDDSIERLLKRAPVDGRLEGASSTFRSQSWAACSVAEDQSERCGWCTSV